MARLIGGPPDELIVAVTRALGVRHLAQGALCGVLPVRRVWLAAAGVDGLHAASMLALAAADRHRRSAALADAAVAAGWAVVSVLGARGLP